MNTIVRIAGIIYLAQAATGFGFNLIASLRRLHRNEIGAWLAESGRFLMQPIGWLTGCERSDSFVLDDMRPGFAECAILLTSMRQKLVRSRHAQLARRRSEQEV